MQIAWIIPKGKYGELRSRGMPEWLDRMAEHVSPDLSEHLRRHRDSSVHPFLLSTVSDRVTRWSKPGLLLIGDAAHTMSPVGAQGLNIAIRDAIVAANQLVPAFATGNVARIDEATRRVEEERVPEVSEVQRLQALPPRVLLRDTWWSRVLLLALPPLLRSSVTGARGGNVVRSLMFGITDVRLAV